MVANQFTARTGAARTAQPRTKPKTFKRGGRRARRTKPTGSACCMLQLHGRNMQQADPIFRPSLDDDPNHLPNSCVKVVAKTGRDLGVAGFCFKQVALEDRTEDDLHAFSPKTSSNDIPTSLPDSRSASRERSIALNSSSVRPSLLKLSSNKLASCSRC